MSKTPGDVMEQATPPLNHLAFVSPTLRERVVARIVQDEKMPCELAERIVDQAVGFLRLAASQPGGHFSPSPLVDIGWHTLILYTRGYAELCKSLTGGRYIHHEPTDDPDVSNVAKGPYRTMRAMKDAGLSVDEALWACVCKDDKAHGCSNCNDGQGCRCGPCNY